MLQLQKLKKQDQKGDPIITGTVTINKYGTGTYYPVQGATITVNSTGSNSRVLGTTTTDQNGNYYINFYSTATQFSVTSSYLGCNNVTNTVSVTVNSTDGLYYGTSNFKLTPNTATLTSTGTGTNVYTNKGGTQDFAGVIDVTINGASYNAYCIDLYTNIAIGDTLFVNGPLPGTVGDLSSQDNWGAVNYIITHYSPSSANEAAAIQCAIWYFTSEQYGAYPGTNTTYPARYQFMTYSGDGLTNGGGTAVRTTALSIISATTSMLYPSSITLQPGTTRVPNGGSSTLTATVTDQNGNPLSGVTVNFTSDKGNLSLTTGTTNSNGQVFTTLSGVANSNSATVIAQVSGNYGSLLYDNPSNPLQNLVAANVLPYTFSASSIVNYDVTANVQLTQTSTTPVNVGDNVKYVVTAYNSGPNAANGIYIGDVVPSGLTNVVVTPSVGTYSNGVWLIPSLANLGSATLTITGTATSSMAGTTTTNTATRTGQLEYDSQPTTTSASVYVKQAGVTITNTGTTPVNVGSTGTYTITAKNNGPDTASYIQINDPTPTGYTANTPSIGTYTGGIWTINSLTNGQTATLTFTKIMTTADAGTSTTNHATATWTEYPSTTTIPDSTINVNKMASVAITNTGTNPVNVGQTGTYTITATNNGPQTATTYK